MKDPYLALAAALVSQATGKGHVCMNLDETADRSVVPMDDEGPQIVYPALDDWEDRLLKTSVVGRPGDFRPLILDGGHRLYLYRYWDYEIQLADGIRQWARHTVKAVNLSLLQEGLRRLFSANFTGAVDWQKVAAAAAVLKPICIISGGPGTGKTFTIAKILVLLLEQARNDSFRIFICAPTGKASAKLKESIELAKQDLVCSQDVITRFPTESHTIHRMLKPIPGSPYFHYSRENPLPADLVVIDEVSMVDLALMSKLMQALPKTARILLVGDKDQLASVQAGSVLGDICDRSGEHCFSKDFIDTLQSVTGERFDDLDPAPNHAPVLRDHIVLLKKSYRFGHDGGIDALSRAVNRGEADTAVRRLMSGTTDSQIEWECPTTIGQFYRLLERFAVQKYAAYLKARHPRDALDLLGRFRILCAVNKGPFGVTAVNACVQEALHRRGLIQPENPWYSGKPVIITRNNYQAGLFNGDIGILMRDPDSVTKEIFTFFSGISGDYRKLSPYRMGEHDTAYALTVHKSQGSEFDHVLLILPDVAYPILTRELIYTGLTRAKKKVSIVGSETVFREAVLRGIDRKSGLRDALWGGTM